MLCLMAKASPVGDLRIGGTPCTVQDLAKFASADNETVERLVEELRSRGVFSTTRSGVIYSRRMRRTADKSRKMSANGKKGAVAKHLKINETPDLPKQNASKTSGKSLALEARDQKLDKEKNIKKENGLFEEEPPPQPASPKRKTRLPNGFPDQENIQLAKAYWAAKAASGIDAALQAEKFRAHHEARGTMAVSWPAAWRTWYINAVEYSQSSQAPAPRYAKLRH